MVKEQDLTLSIKIEEKIHPIAKITHTSGLKGDVRLRPLSRYFEDYIKNKELMLGTSEISMKDIILEIVNGIGKKQRFKFQGVDSISNAKKLIGKTIFIKTSSEDKINLISKKIMGYEVITSKGEKAGKLIDVMWLPNNDAYVIKNGNKEYLIPIIQELIISLNHDMKRVFIKHMDGLLD